MGALEMPLKLSVGLKLGLVCTQILQEMNMGLESQSLRESSYEKLLKKFQSYAFGPDMLETIEVPDVSVRKRMVANDVMIELKQNMNRLEELSHKLKFMMTEINT
ncbi:MAG: hypothetical protein KDD25_06555, partial [Bdellovibrionales bacterium]|nr:hypothetical protein [Bdellovibrionales bacterium]